ISKEDVKESIRMVGLDPGSNKKVGKFSLGMRQRLGIAQAIMENPNLIILDEPMNGLDKKGIEDVKELLLKLKGDGKTILMASHYAEDMEICDEVFQMEDGKLGDMK
ncbi:ATP-binding cassette domain-containing protein, partial [Agathobacter rectalis]|nr:ATP-binding cassette domain-containing protein [Agathobacter rectalis]